MRRLFKVLTALSPRLAAHVAARAFVTPLARPIDRDDRQFLTTARAFRLRTAYGTIQAYEWAADGPTVLVAHGWVSHAARMRALIEALRARGLKVVSFDAPAHGRSSGRRADLHGFRAAVAAVVTSIGTVHAVVAHSFGALSAASWLAEEPAAQSVRAAVLIGLPRDVGYLFESFTLVLGLRADVVARVRALFQRRYGRLPEDYSAVAFARHLRMPVLLIHGGNDELVPPAHATDVADALPDARVQIAPQLNHSAPLRDPASVQLISEFIASRLRRLA